MGILSRFLRTTPNSEPDEIFLSEDDPWEVSAPEDMGRFLRALPLLALEDAVVYFEGTEEALVGDYIRGISISPLVRVRRGLVGEPAPDCHHVPVTPSAMDGLASFLQRHSKVFVCYHCHVYRNRSVLLEWFDACGKDPIYLSRALDREVVQRFAQAMGSSFSASSEADA